MAMQHQPQQQQHCLPPHPMPEFRDADHYRSALSPLCITDGSHEIVRPKPRSKILAVNEKHEVALHDSFTFNALTMSCQQDCRCYLCRELDGFRPTVTSSATLNTSDNFILVRPNADRVVGRKGNKPQRVSMKREMRHSDRSSFAMRIPDIKMSIIGYWKNKDAANKKDIKDRVNEFRNPMHKQAWESSDKIQVKVLSEVLKKPCDVNKKNGEMTKNAGEVTRKPVDATRKPGEVTKKPGEVTKKPGEITRKPSDLYRKPNEALRKSNESLWNINGQNVRIENSKMMDDDVIVDGWVTESRDDTMEAKSTGSVVVIVRGNEDNGPGGGSREMVPSAGYGGYQQPPPPSGPSDLQRTPNLPCQPLRSPTNKTAVSEDKSPAPPPTPSKLHPPTPISTDPTMEQLVPERDTNPGPGLTVDVCKSSTVMPDSMSNKIQHRTMSQAVASATRQLNSSSSTRCNTGGSTGRGGHMHHHLSVEELRLIQRRQDSNGSSSDDGTRSSGHASMSDGHLSSSPPAERHQHYRSHLNSVPEDERLSASVMQSQSRAARKAGHNRSRHRATPAKLVPSGSGLEDIKLAIQQLTMRSHTSNTGYSTSTYSSLSGSESSEPAVRRLMRHSSLETINTNVTSADEFVWVDSHNRLVELQHLPWSNHDVLKVIQNGRIKEHMERISMETIPRLSYLLQRALVRVGREAQRLARPLGMCSKQEVCSALRVILCPALADSCTKACLRAAAMFAVSGDLQLKQSKSCRAGLQLSVGRFQRWMADVRLGKFVHEYAAVYLTAGLENLLEEIILQCLPNEADTILTATMFEHAIANNGDLWGLLQPYAHLNAGRIASGALAMPRWSSVSSVNTESTHTSSLASGKSIEQSLLTTCVGSVHELTELLTRINTRPLTWTPPAIQALFYFMRCSQLEHAEHVAPIQELVYERAYVVLPPLVEWLRVTAAHAEHRHSTTLDQDDVMQAARLLLPGVDCPIRQIGLEESGTAVGPKRPGDEVECVRRLKSELAFKMLRSGRSDLIPHALQLLPSNKKLNCVNETGLSPLMLAVLLHDEACARCLLDAGADPDIETPPYGTAGCPGVNAETQHWTALTYAALQGTCNIARLLLERGAHVEGGARLSEDKCTQTPLQVAAACGHMEMVALLLSHGAHPFLSTLLKDSLCYSGAAQRGSYSAIAVAAAHGQRATLHKLLAHPHNTNNKEVLSLEEILAEGASSQMTADRRGSRLQVTCPPNSDTSACSMNHSGNESLQLLKLSKAQIKSLQEAMYHSAENNHLDITLDLRNLGIPWTLHCWMHTLATAHDQRLENIIDQLLQDFLQVWPDDYSTQFVDECLPLLFNIFRFSKNEGTTLLLADIFSTCFGWESVKDIRDTSFSGGTRIDPKFVNNPELSDVQFRVEGRVFYGHKIVLVTWSPRFRAMLSSKLCDGNPPIVHINDIRYHIFQLVMQYLYNGGCENLQVEQSDVLELMAAANFFQLDGLLRFCEAQCSSMVDLDNIVSMYIHAKVYNASELLEYCQGFLLQNMVALLTYDDSVKRLLFGKKLHSHDVLAGLLLTLQARIKARNVSPTIRTNAKPK